MTLAAPLAAPRAAPSHPSRRSLRAARAAAADAPASAVLLRVTFSLRARVEFGDRILLVGEDEALGQWDVARAVALNWSPGDVWTSTVSLPENVVVRYKFLVLRADGTLQWQPGEDSTTVASRSAAALAAEASLPLDVLRVGIKTQFGEEVLVCGDAPGLGSWDAAHAVPLRWSGHDVWQASLALPRATPVAYKLLLRTPDGATRWLEGTDAVLPAASSRHAPRSILDPPTPTPAGLQPVTRHFHRTLPSFWQPWFWAPELGAGADCLVSLAADEADTPPLSFDDGVAGAVAMAALLDVRDAAPNGFQGLVQATESAGATGAAAVSALRAAAAQGTAGAGASAAPRPPPASAAGLATSLAAASALTAGAAVVASSISSATAAEAAALGLLAAFGARNLLFAEDRKALLEAAGSRDALMDLLRANMAAVGLGEDAGVADSLSKQAQAMGWAWDPLQLLGDKEPVAPRRALPPAGKPTVAEDEEAVR